MLWGEPQGACAAMRTITLKNVSKTFYDKSRKLTPVLAIKDFNLHIEDGEAMVLLGPSGCGKTTLLRLIAGLDEPDTGEIYYSDIPLDAIPIEERGIGMVFQNYVLIPHWESRKTVGFFLRLRDREEEVPAHVNTVANITGVDIEKLMGRFPRNLSGGEKQRVSIARAFARDLELLLFDEPFANLDAKFRGQARVELKRLIQEFNVTLVYVTHDQVEAISMATRMAIMKDGVFVQTGSPREIYKFPTDPFVASFVGETNFITGNIQEISNGSVKIETSVGILHSECVYHNFTHGQEVTCSIRPETIQLNQNSNVNQFDATLSHITYLGRVEEYELMIADQHSIKTVLYNPEKEIKNEGDTVNVSIPPEAIIPLPLENTD